jgi:hypothetical protein
MVALPTPRSTASRVKGAAMGPAWARSTVSRSTVPLRNTWPGAGAGPRSTVVVVAGVPPLNRSNAEELPARTLMPKKAASTETTRATT